MKKIEAKTLEEAYEKAARAFNCSVTDLKYEIIQHPSRGFLGIGTKNAVIVADCTAPGRQEKPADPLSADPRPVDPDPQTKPASSPQRSREESAAAESVSSDTPEVPSSIAPETTSSESAILSGFFDAKGAGHSPTDAPADTSAPSRPKRKKRNTIKPDLSDRELGALIEERLSTLIRSTCFDIDTVEVDVIDGTAYIFIDGEDAALLIGKEGYRYNALSYLLYNWIHNEYGLFIKLEIAQFLASQQEMIRNYIQPVIEHVHQNGWGKTRPLNGILVQIALEQLREEFPHKYVAIKRTRQGERYILINEFNKRS